MPDVIRMPMQTLLMEAAYRSDVSMMSEEDRAALSEDMDEAELDHFNAVGPSKSSGASVLSEGLGDLGLGDDMAFFAPPPPPAAPGSAFPAGEDEIAEAESFSSEDKAGTGVPEDDDDTVEFDISGSNFFMVDLPEESSSDSLFKQSADKESEPEEDAADSSPERSLSSSAEEDFGSLLDDGFDAFREKNYQLAMTLWKRAEELKPEDKSLKYNLKLVAKKLGEG